MATLRRRGDKWQVQVRRQGVRPLSHSFLTRKDAEAWGRLMEIQADRKELPSDPRALDRVTLGQLVVRYRDTVTINKRGHEVERIVLEAFLRHRICTKTLSQLNPSDFAAYRDERLRSIKPSSLKRQLAPLHNLFEVAKTEWGLPIKGNPLDSVQLRGFDQRRERRLRAGELDRLTQATTACRNPHLLPTILFALQTGMRRGEILALQWDHVDLSGRSLLIPQSKNGRPRTIPLSRAAVALLEAQGRSGANRPFPITANALRLAWERLRRRAGLEELHFHDLRHEAISRFFELNLTVPEVASISGHRDARTLLRYAHADQERMLARLDSR